MSKNLEVLVHTGDGTAGSGKGTIGSYLDGQGVPALDTGRGFRAVTELWLREQADTDGSFSRDDHERSQDILSRFVADQEKLEEFTATLAERISFGVEGVRIDQDYVTEDDIQRVLYADSINKIISLLAQRKTVRSFCVRVASQFITDAAERGVGEVYIDGRSGRAEITSSLRRDATLGALSRLALTGFFRVDPVEAAHRILSRDEDIPYRSLGDDHIKVTDKAASIERRNQADSDAAVHDAPMCLTADYVEAWSDEVNSASIRRVVGTARNGSDSSHVLFDTTNRAKEETLAEYESWRLAVVDYLRG